MPGTIRKAAKTMVNTAPENKNLFLTAPITGTLVQLKIMKTDSGFSPPREPAGKTITLLIKNTSGKFETCSLLNKFIENLTNMTLNLISGAKLRGIAAGLLVMTLIAGCQKSEFETSKGIVSDAKTTAIAGAIGQKFIVVSKSEALPAGFENQISAYGEIVSSMPAIGQLVVKPTTTDFEKKVAKLGNVLSVFPDFKMRWIEPVGILGQVGSESIGDNESYFAYLWNMRAITLLLPGMPDTPVKAPECLSLTQVLMLTTRNLAQILTRNSALPLCRRKSSMSGMASSSIMVPM
jgi:hypothetical protein